MRHVSPPFSQLRFLAVLVACVAAATAAQAVHITVSTDTGSTLGGLTLQDGDLAHYDTDTGVATLAFDEGAFPSSENIDGAHRFSNGNFLISTDTQATLGGLTFTSGDIALYDAAAGTASLFFDEGLFSNSANIDALSLLPSGNLVLSTSAGETLGGLTFRDGDLVEYDLANGVATIFLSEDLFSGNENIDGVHVFALGILLSTSTNATLGGLTFEDGDVVLYDPTTGVATLYFDEDDFGGNENVDAIAAPEPGTAVLLATGLALLGFAGRRRR